MTEHLEAWAVAGFATNSLNGEDRKRAVRHLLTGCQVCRERIRQALSGAPEAGEYGPLAKGKILMDSLIATMDRAVGRLLWAELERMPAARRRSAVKQDRRFHTLGVFEATLRAARMSCKDDPCEGAARAELALVLAELADADIGPIDELRFDWRSSALVALACARQAGGDFQRAQGALDLAEGYLDNGTGDSVERGMFWVRKAELMAELGQFEKSVELLNRAASRFRRVGETNRQGKTLIQQAAVLQHLDLERALKTVEAGLAMIDLEQEPRAELAGRHTQAYCYNQLGEPDEAEGILDTYHYLAVQYPEFGVQASLERLRAGICLRKGQAEEGERRLRDVRAQYLEHGRGYGLEAVLTSIDLAEFLAGQQRIGEAIFVASEIFPILKAWGLHRDTLALVAMLAEHLQGRVRDGIGR
jgi:tetratricopeptide (TPR) repeat protein